MPKIVRLEKYREVYKCLKCGETINGEERKRSEIDGRPGFRLHGCVGGDFGIGMLIGYEKVNAEKE